MCIDERAFKIVPLFLVISLFKRSLARRSRCDWIGLDASAIFYNTHYHETIITERIEIVRLLAHSRTNTLGFLFIWPYFVQWCITFLLRLPPPPPLTCFVTLRLETCAKVSLFSWWISKDKWGWLFFHDNILLCSAILLRWWLKYCDMVHNSHNL